MAIGDYSPLRGFRQRAHFENIPLLLLVMPYACQVFEWNTKALAYQYEMPRTEFNTITYLVSKTVRSQRFWTAQVKGLWNKTQMFLSSDKMVIGGAINRVIYSLDKVPGVHRLMRNRSSTNNIILAIKHIEVKVEPGYPSSGPQAELAAVHIDKPLPPKHNTLTAHQQGQVGHNVEHQKHMKCMLEMSLSRGPHSTSVFMRGYSRRLIPATKPSSILRSPMIRGGKRNIELQAQAMIDLLPAEFHNNGNILYYKLNPATHLRDPTPISCPPPQYQKQAPHPTKTRPQDNSKPLTLSEKKRKEAALGRQRAHARADTSEMNRVAMDDLTDGLRWAFYLTLSGLWDSFLPSPTSQTPYIAFEFLKH
ncbi:hypothetical protein FOXB_12907 [Fusarium oxysporum f. sp. conglutinans Fo5176]|uniref:Uncharacterized protein n=2 Tax=Fusarium oxysporum f. sp. conglutinans TaxID=100902 RepID=F9G2J8_FUSOF|nr:hypothetical protein FOXB_12907 [Fusarium oxysporum f. sp. conglutinans Fo5176]